MSKLRPATQYARLLKVGMPRKMHDFLIENKFKVPDKKILAAYFLSYRYLNTHNFSRVIRLVTKGFLNADDVRERIKKLPHNHGARGVNTSDVIESVAFTLKFYHLFGGVTDKQILRFLNKNRETLSQMILHFRTSKSEKTKYIKYVYNESTKKFFQELIEEILDEGNFKMESRKAARVHMWETTFGKRASKPWLDMMTVLES